MPDRKRLQYTEWYSTTYLAEPFNRDNLYEMLPFRAFRVKLLQLTQVSK